MNIMWGSTVTGETLVLMVLEPGNLHKLRQGQPITQRLNDLFPDGLPKKLEIAIHYSETPVADARELSKMSNMVFNERAAQNQIRQPHCPECKSTVEQLGVWRNESPMGLVFCPMCGCIFGMVPSEVVKNLPKEGDDAKGQDSRGDKQGNQQAGSSIEGTGNSNERPVEVGGGGKDSADQPDRTD